MIQMCSKLRVADNSGAKKVSCISVVGASNKMSARLGDVIVANVKEAVFGAKVKKGEVVRAVIVRTARETRRRDGTYIKFDDNSVVI
ncbi:MAG: 50S ribosomal protein L14, partial [Thermodesulfobacteriota bacterium]